MQADRYVVYKLITRDERERRSVNSLPTNCANNYYLKIKSTRPIKQSDDLN